MTFWKGPGHHLEIYAPVLSLAQLCKCRHLVLKVRL